MHSTAPDLVDPVVDFENGGWQTGVCDPHIAAYRGTAVSCVRAAWWVTMVGDHDCHGSPASVCSCGTSADHDPCPRTASAGAGDFVAEAVVLRGRIEPGDPGHYGALPRVTACLVGSCTGDRVLSRKESRCR